MKQTALFRMEFCCSWVKESKNAGPLAQVMLSILTSLLIITSQAILNVNFHEIKKAVVIYSIFKIIKKRLNAAVTYCRWQTMMCTSGAFMCMV